jgi:hypothetical protein
MPAPRFITSDAQIGAEGLYIRSVAPPAVVGGVQNNIIGVTGRTVRGPAGVVEINSPQRFIDVFGGRDYGSGGPIVGEIWKSLLNKPVGRLVVARAIASDAATAEADFVDGATPAINIAASSPGAWGNDIVVDIEAATDGDGDHFNLRVSYLGREVVYRNLDVTAGNDNLLQVIGDDDANLVEVTKLADGRPDDAAAASLTDTAGDDGTLVDADYTAGGGPLDLLSGFKGVGIVYVAGHSTAAVKAQLLVLADASPDRLFLVCPDTAAITQAAAETEVAGLRSALSRLVYCFNHPTTLDPETATLVTTEPHAWMASILSQTDADVHPGDDDSRQFTTGIRGLTFEGLQPGDYDSFREVGICAFERHQTGGHVFVSGVTTNLERPEITERRIRDFLISAMAQRTSGDVKKSNTQTRRDRRRADISGFLSGQARQGRYVDRLASGEPAFVYDTEVINSDEQRALGVQKDLARIRTIAFGLFIVLFEEVGATVQITEQG